MGGMGSSYSLRHDPFRLLNNLCDDNLGSHYVLCDECLRLAKSMLPYTEFGKLASLKRVPTGLHQYLRHPVQLEVQS